MKRAFCCLLSIIVLIAAIPVTVFATDMANSGYCGENLSWVIDDEGTLFITGTGAMYDYDTYPHAPWNDYRYPIKNAVISDGVTNIGNYAFYYCTSLASVSIPISISDIGDYAFYACTSLANIPCLENISQIGDYAFSLCHEVETIIIPSSVSSIGEGAFYDCRGVRSLDILNGVLSIGPNAFSLPNFTSTSISIPESVYFIGESAFVGIDCLVEIDVDSRNANYCSIDGILYDKNITTLILYPNGKKDTEYSIPSSVIRIGAKAFYRNRNLTKLVLPSYLDSIGKYAFYYSALSELVLPSEIVDIGEGAFSDCHNLYNIVLPRGMTKINDRVFQRCSNLSSVVIPDTIVAIGEETFASSGIKNIIIPDTVQSIGSYAFSYCTSLTGINIPKSVTKISNRTFKTCSNLKSIGIPDSIVKIDIYAFEGCDKLENIYYLGNEDTWEEIFIENGNDRLKNAEIHYNSIWSDNNESDINNKYNYFGRIDNITDLQDTIENVLIDGVVYNFSEEYLAIPHLWPYQYNDYRDQYYYASFNLNENGEIIDFNWMQGVCDKLNEWDEKNSIINVGQYTIAPPDKTLPAGCYAVSAITKNSFPYNEISKWVGDSVRVYSNGDEVFKVIHINYGNGVISSYDALSTPQCVYIDNIAYPILEDDNLCKTIKDNQFEKVVFTLYDGIVVNVEKLSDVVSTKVSIGYGSNHIVKYLNGQYVRGALDKSNTISVKVSNEIKSKLDTEMNDVYYEYIKQIPELAVNVTKITIDSNSNMIELLGNTEVSLKKELLPGESYTYGVNFNFNNSYIPYDGEMAYINCSVEIENNSNQNSTYKNNTYFEIQYDQSITSENQGDQTQSSEISSKAEIVADELKKLDECVAWSATMSDFLTDSQEEMLGYALYSAVILADAPKETFDEYVSNKILTELFGDWKIPVGTFDFEVPVTIRVDTKKYGQLIIQFICSGSSYTLGDSSFGSLGAINYEIVGGTGSENVPKELTSGLAGMLANANVDAFKNAAYDLAMAELKSAFDLGYGNTLDEVSDIIFGDTIVDPIIKMLGYNSYKDAAWEILTYPSKQMYVKCPVDVYVYDKSGKLCASIIDGIAQSSTDDINVVTIGGEKVFNFYGNATTYSFKFLPTANGNMDVEIYELSGPGRIMRSAYYYDLELQLGNAYDGLMDMVYLDTSPYSLNSVNGDVTADYDVFNITRLNEQIPIATTNIALNKEAISLNTGASEALIATVSPDNATNKAVSWKSSDTTVATVDDNGKVTALKKGTATITVTTDDGNFIDTCVVTVTCAHANRTPVTAKVSDCKNKGWDAYAKCDDCGQLLAENGTTEIDNIPFRPLSEQHTGGTATCTGKAVCTVCDNSYGVLASHSYTAAEKKAEALKTEGNCRDNAVYYYSCSACGKVENDDGHTFLGDKVADTHGGGTTLVNQIEANHETQTDGYTGDTKCLGCGGIIGYGEPIPVRAHTPANVWSNDSEYHWKECSVDDCAVIIDNSKVAHLPDREEATETDPIKCSVCGYEIAPVLGHAHSHGTEWKSDKDNHWNECDCGNKANTEAHTDANKDGKCDVCEYEVGTVTPDPDNKPEDTNKPSDDVHSPQTGDNSMMWLWIIMLFVSGGALVSLTVYSRKRKSY